MPSDRLPPQNLEAERGVIGAAVLDNEVLHDVVPVLKPEHFYRDSHQVIYRAIRDLYAQSKPIDSIILEEELRRRGELDRVGGLDAIVEIIEGVPHAANAHYHARIVAEKFVARELVRFHNAGLDACYSNNFTADDLLSRAEHGICALGAGRGDSPRDISEIMAGALSRYESRKGGAGFGILTGIVALDDTLTGLKDGEVIVLAARPSMGKTAFADNVAENVAADPLSPTPTYFASLEMGADAIGDRLLTQRAGVDGHRFRVADLGESEEARVRLAAFDLSSAPLVIDDAAPRSVDQITAAARRMKMSKGIGLVIVDYLQLIEGGSGDDDRNRQEQIAKIMRRMKGLATSLRIPVVLLSQLNRGVEAREDKRPRMSDLRESGAIEQDADVVLLMYRPDYYDPTDRPGYVELIIAKNRNGPTGIVELFFRRETGKFSAYRGPDNPAMGHIERAGDHPF